MPQFKITVQNEEVAQLHNITLDVSTTAADLQMLVNNLNEESENN